MDLPQLVLSLSERFPRPMDLKAHLEAGRFVDQVFPEAERKAVRAFRKLHQGQKRLDYIERIRRGAETPVVTAIYEEPRNASGETLPGNVSPTHDAIVLAEPEQTTLPVHGIDLEVLRHEGAVFVTIRSIADSFTKQSNNLRLSLENKGFEVIDLIAKNNLGRLRKTPCVRAEQAILVLADLDERGMDAPTRERLLFLRREIPKAIEVFLQKTQAMVSSFGAVDERLRHIESEMLALRQEIRSLRVAPALPPSPVDSLPRLPIGTRWVVLADIMREVRDALKLTKINPSNFKEFVLNLGVDVRNNDKGTPMIQEHHKGAIRRGCTAENLRRAGIVMTATGQPDNRTQVPGP